MLQQQRRAAAGAGLGGNRSSCSRRSTRTPAAAVRQQRRVGVLVRASSADEQQQQQPQQSPPPQRVVTGASPPRPGPPRPGPGGPPLGRMPLGPNGRPMMMGPDGQPVEMVRMDERPEAFSGVAAIDRGENDANAPTSAGRAALLVAGDLAVLLAFAAFGRHSHGEPLTLAATLGTAAPFAAGWLAAGLGLTGAYGADAQGSKPGPAAAAAAKTWAVGVPLGIALRSAARGYVPAVAFVGVAMAATGVLMVGWRAALAAATPEPEKLTPQQAAARRRDRQGSPLDGLMMVMSLVKRW